MIWDITASWLHQIRLTALLEITTLLNQETYFLKATETILRILRWSLGWEIFAVWRLNKNSLRFECISVLEDPTGQFPLFLTALKGLKIDEVEKTLASQVFKTNKPACSKNFGKENYIISSIAAKEGIQGAVAYPLIEEGKLNGIIENFSRNPLSSEELDAEELQFFLVLGTLLGQFLQKMDAYKTFARLNAIVTYSKSAIYSSDLEGYIITWNPAAEGMYGWAAGEIIGKSTAILYPKERLHEFNDTIRKFTLGQSTQNYETQRIRKDGTRIWIDVTYSLMKDEKGHDFGVSIIAQDITKQKEMGLQLKKSEEKFRTFVETSQDWIWEIDTTFKYTYASPSVEKILGFAPADIVGKEMFFFLTEEDRMKVKAEMQECVREKRNWAGRINSWTSHDFSKRFLESNGNVMLDEKGAVIGFRGIERDITERIRLEKSRSEFLSIISHELKTPLTSIHGALTLLTADEHLDSEKAKELLAVSLRNAERMKHLIAETLDLEKIRQGKLAMTMQSVLLADMIREALHISQPIATARKVILEEGAILPEARVNGDPERLVQVLLNLLSNAIKFSPTEGKVVVWMEKIQDKVRVLVRDQGPGVPKEFQSKIFQQFAQAENRDERAFGGTGLGLNICKGIIEQMGGLISFISQQGQGATFYFELSLLK